MNVYEAIAKRQTIRDFDDREIPQEVLYRLLEAGLQAPSNDHLRKWEFIIVPDKARRIALIQAMRPPKNTEEAVAVVNELGMVEPSQRGMYIDAIPKQHSMLLNAGVLILPCFYSSGLLLQPETLSSLNSFASILCCIENILVAAASEGIFGVTRIPAENERQSLKALLNVADGYEIPCYLALGYPEQGTKRMEQYKTQLQDKIHINGW
jgi:nitroreductase